MNKIDNKNLNVSGVFKNFYLVPDYQREYVWEEKHVNQLLEDIYEEFSNDNKSEYFIGSIVVCENDDKRYEVIDGQQRLTTLFVALSALKNHLKASKEDVSDIQTMLFSTTRDASGKQVSAFRLELQYENCSGVLSRMIDSNPPDEFGSNSEENIVEAYDTVTRFVEANFKTLDELYPFLGYFLNNVKLIQIETPKISDALKIFETINERGVGLNPMDLLKNLIFRHVDKKDFNKLKDKWKTITTLLESHKEKPLRFLRYFIMANYQVKNAKGEEIIREDEIYDWITSNKSQCKYESEPFAFVEFLKANAEAYVNYLDGKDKNGADNIYLDNIKKLSGSFRQHLMLLLAAKDLKKDLFDHLTKQIEVLIFYYILTKEPTKEFERKFSKWAKEIKTIDTQEKLNAFIEQNLLSDVRAKEAEFKNAFLFFHERSLQGYRLRYILGKLTQFIDQQVLGVYEDRNLDNYLMKGIEIEHILPQTPKKELRESFGDDYDEFKAKLGNLTLFEKPQNIVAGNNYFVEKKVLYKTSKFYLTKSIAVLETVGNNSAVNRTNKYLKTFDSWGRETIKDRQGLLFGIAQDIWKVRLMK
jgi:uncharacterized protein with ParB-like and HNH nuclease domain